MPNAPTINRTWAFCCTRWKPGQGGALFLQGFSLPRRLSYAEVAEPGGGRERRGDKERKTASFAKDNGHRLSLPSRLGASVLAGPVWAPSRACQRLLSWQRGRGELRCPRLTSALINTFRLRIHVVRPSALDTPTANVSEARVFEPMKVLMVVIFFSLLLTSSLLFLHY